MSDFKNAGLVSIIHKLDDVSTTRWTARRKPRSALLGEGFSPSLATDRFAWANDKDRLPPGAAIAIILMMSLASWALIITAAMWMISAA
jgi:hypothetical protein